MGQTKRSWSPWSFTIRTLPASIYTFVTLMKETHGLSHWQTVILALLGLQQRAQDSPDQFATAVTWIKEKYPDGKTPPTGTPF